MNRLRSKSLDKANSLLSGGLRSAFSGSGFLTALHLVDLCGLVDNAFYTAFLQTDSLTDAIAEEVKLCSADNSGTNNFDLGNFRRMKGELPFNTFAGDNAADSEHRTGTSAITGNNDTVEDLDTFFAAFEDLAMNVNRVTDFKLRDFLLDAKRIDLFQQFLTHNITLTLS